MRKLVSFLILIFLLSLFLPSISSEISLRASTDRLNVIVTIPPQAFLVESIAGKRAEVTSMVPEDGSPHSSSLTPGELKKIRKAEIYFRVGTPLPFEENNLPVFREENREMIVVDTSQSVELKALNEHYGEPATNGSGGETEAVDNHIWLSPANLKKMAENVLQGLSRLDPSAKEYYEKNYNALLEKISTIEHELKGILGGFAGRSFIVYHPAWGYFGDEFKLHQVAVQERGDKPGPGRVREIAVFAKDHGIGTIIASTQFSPSTAQMVASTFGGSVAEINPLERNILGELGELARAISNGYKES